MPILHAKRPPWQKGVVENVVYFLLTSPTAWPWIPRPGR